MSVALACTWRPRGEIGRFQALRRQLEQIYQHLVIAVPRDINAVDLDRVKALDDSPRVRVVMVTGSPEARYRALQSSLQTEAGHIHAVDMDRLLRWVETKPLEWRQMVEAVRQADCLIIGRTEAALRTHPQALQLTEQIINTIFSRLLGQAVDLGGGARGFSRAAAQFLAANSSPGPWTDAEWPMLLHRAGYAVEHVAVDGLDWESADRYQTRAADYETQLQLAAVYDQNANHWARRVQMARDIIEAGLAVYEN